MLQLNPKVLLPQVWTWHVLNQAVESCTSWHSLFTVRVVPQLGLNINSSSFCSLSFTSCCQQPNHQEVSCPKHSQTMCKSWQLHLKDKNKYGRDAHSWIYLGPHGIFALTHRYRPICKSTKSCLSHDEQKWSSPSVIGSMSGPIRLLIVTPRAVLGRRALGSTACCKRLLAQHITYIHILVMVSSETKGTILIPWYPCHPSWIIKIRKIRK